jgi:hypothetical protein
VGHGEPDDVVVRFDEERDHRRLARRPRVGRVLEGDHQPYRGLGLDHATDDVDPP